MAQDFQVARRQVGISNEFGLHLRVADKFVKLANAFQSELSVHCKGIIVNGKIILILLATPTAISVTTHVLLDHFRYKPWEVWWVAARVALPLLLIFFPQRRVQRSGLAALNLTQLLGLFR